MQTLVVATQAAALARVQPALLARAAGVEADAVGRLGLPDQLERGFTRLAPFHGRDAGIGQTGRAGASGVAQAGAQAQGLAQGPAHGQAHAVPVGALAAVARFHQGLSLPLVRQGLGEDLNHAAQRLGAVEHRHGPAHHLDPRDVGRTDPVQLEIGAADQAVAGTDALTVDQDQGVARVHAAQRKRLAATDRPAEGLDGGLQAQQLQQVVAAQSGHVFAAQHAHRGRGQQQRQGAAGGADHHGGQGLLGLCQGRKQGNERQQRDEGQGGAHQRDLQFDAASVAPACLLHLEPA